MGTSNRQVAHLWAAQSRERCKGSNFYFYGPTIYSYGEHFPIAAFVTAPNGERVVLFTTDSYGMATSKHLNYARSALFGLDVRVFHVPHVPRSFYKPETIRHRCNLDGYRERIAAAQQYAAKKFRLEYRRESAMAAVVNLAKEANAYRLAFMPEYAEFPEVFTESELAAVAVRVAAENKARAVELAADKARRDAEAATEREEWRAGERAHCGWGDVMLRLSTKGDVIETSRGARVPAAVAPMLWTMVQRVRMGHVFEFPALGQRIGDFALRDITNEGDLIIGCHHIRFSELDRMAGLLGLKDAPPEVAAQQHA